MRTVSQWMCLWPGLAGLWREGQGRSLAVAGAFAVLINLALIVTLVWPGILGTSPLIVLWFTVAVFWGIAAWNSHWRLAALRRLPNQQDREALFRQAQVDYLKGHWLETESQLNELIRGRNGDDHDVDAHLFLATLYRRTRRIDEAKQQLDLLDRLDGAEKWRVEIARERQQINRTESAADEEQATISNAA